MFTISQNQTCSDIPPTAEQVVRDKGGQIAFLKSGTLASFATKEAFNQFQDWLTKRNYTVLSIRSSLKIVYQAPNVTLTKGQ